MIGIGSNNFLDLIALAYVESSLQHTFDYANMMCLHYVINIHAHKRAHIRLSYICEDEQFTGKWNSSPAIHDI